VSNIIRRHIDNLKLLLVRIFLLSHSFIFFSFYFLKLYIRLYSWLILWFMYFYFYVYVFLFMFMYLHLPTWHSSATLTEVFPCFFLRRKANARVKPTKTGHGLHSSKIFLLFYLLFVLCRSVYCFCVNVYCTATGCQPNCS
jgi:hypothetical protein